MSKVSKTQQIRDYIQYSTGKFSNYDIVCATGIDSHTVAKRMGVFAQDGIVRAIYRDKGRIIWVRTIVHPKATKPTMIVSEAEQRIIRKKLEDMTVAELAKEMGISREAIYLRLRSMAPLSKIKRAKVGRLKSPRKRPNLDVLRLFGDTPRYGHCTIESWEVQRMYHEGYLHREKDKVGRQYKYWLSEAGKEAINAEN